MAGGSGVPWKFCKGDMWLLCALWRVRRPVARSASFPHSPGDQFSSLASGRSHGLAAVCHRLHWRPAAQDSSRWGCSGYEIWTEAATVSHLRRREPRSSARRSHRCGHAPSILWDLCLSASALAGALAIALVVGGVWLPLCSGLCQPSRACSSTLWRKEPWTEPNRKVDKGTTAQRVSQSVHDLFDRSPRILDYFWQRQKKQCKEAEFLGRDQAASRAGLRDKPT